MHKQKINCNRLQHLKVSENFFLAADVRGKNLCFHLPLKSFPAYSKGTVYTETYMQHITNSSSVRYLILTTTWTSVPAWTTFAVGLIDIIHASESDGIQSHLWIWPQQPAYTYRYRPATGGMKAIAVQLRQLPQASHHLKKLSTLSNIPKQRSNHHLKKMKNNMQHSTQTQHTHLLWQTFTY